MADTDRYTSPLCGRYASAKMQHIFSQDHRTVTWRRLWVALAETERELGLDISQAQIDELSAHIEDIDYDAVAAYEKQTRHDVMAHIKAYGDKCPSAAGIIHLGATSCYVTDNADVLIYKEALLAVKSKLASVIRRLCAFALKYKDLPTLGYTHFQPAQLTTVGKRASLWIQDFMSDMEELDFALSSLKMLGSKGTTGTQASFLELFSGDGEKVKRADALIAKKMGLESVYPVSGQTYPRKLDSRILNALSAIAQSAYRFAGDMRLLQHEKELEEPFESTQVGSSAMAYKRNPMRCERICSLSRYVMANALNAPMTASSQWLERTLDDSANRRISLPEAFLAVDAALILAANVSGGIRVYEKVIEKHIREYLPFIATENLLMEGVKRGGDRQRLHEIIRERSMEATARMKEEGADCDLMARLAADPDFPMGESELAGALVPADYVGRAPEQTEEYIRELVLPGLPEEEEGDFRINV